MKLLLYLILSLSTLSVRGQMNYANSNGTISASTPFPFVDLTGAVFYSPTSNQLAAAGWMTVSNVQQVAAGWMVAAWNIVPLGNGWCNLTIANSNNLNALFIAGITNNPLWNPATLADLHSYTNRLDLYVGFGGETNALVNDFTTWQYCLTNPPFLISFTNFQNMTFCLHVADTEILLFPGITNTTQFWKIMHQNGIL